MLLPQFHSHHYTRAKGAAQLYPAVFSELITTRRWLAVGLESGEIVIYSSLLTEAGKWQEELVITSRYVLPAYLAEMYCS